MKSITFTDAVLPEGLKGTSATTTSYTNPVLTGNYPDPSVIQVGQDYWATATPPG